MEKALVDVALWDEVKDRLHAQALGLSGGQQQRLCIARALATNPDVLLMDEPTSALDPVSTLKIEELMLKLKEKYTIAIVTHNMQQASRISDQTAFSSWESSLSAMIRSRCFQVLMTIGQKIILPAVLAEKTGCRSDRRPASWCVEMRGEKTG